MRTLLSPVRRRAALLLVVVLVLVGVAAGACVPTPADGPDAVVHQALELAASKDLDGLRGLACAGQEDRIREQLGLGAAMDGAELLPGLDTQALLDAVALDTGDVDIGAPAIDGDVAQVPVTGTLKVTFDAEAMRPILRQVLESQGTSMSDEQLDALLRTLEAYGQDVPVDETVRLVREAGGWRICQDLP